MNTNNYNVVVVLAVLCLALGGSGVVSGADENETSTPTSNTSTPPQEESISTPTPTTTEADESIEEQVKNGVEKGVDESTGDNEEASSQQSSGCVEVVTKSRNTTTKECIPRHYQRIDNSTEVIAVDWSSNVVTIVFKSEHPQQITVTDPYSVDKEKEGGDVNYIDDTVKSGKSVIRIRATEKSGDKELWIGTSADLKYIRSPGTPFLANGLQNSLLYMAALGGSLGSLIVATLYALYRWRKLKNGWTDVLKGYKP